MGNVIKMETKLFKINIIQRRWYPDGQLNYAEVTNKLTGKTIKDWFCPFNKKGLERLQKLNWEKVKKKD